MNPATALQAGCQPPRQGSNNRVLIRKIRFHSRWKPFECLSIHFLACKDLELPSPLHPESGDSDGVFCDVEHHRTKNKERFPFELASVQAGKKIPVNLGIRIP